MHRSKSLAAVAVLASFAAFAEIIPIPLGDGANSSFRDDIADDKKGGFIDLGSNDLRMLPAGRQVIGMIPFEIAACSSSADKACIVLGGEVRKDFAQSARVTLDKPVGGECLYLLHASAFTSADGKPVVGSLRMAYDDGTSESKNVRVGRDVADWTASSDRSNATRAWTIYNLNTQVSLFVSRFPLAKGRRLASLSFEAEKGAWIVAAVSIGDSRKPRTVTVDLKVDRDYETPELFDRPLPIVKPGAKPRNVVIVLGDGMGMGTLFLASHHLRRRPGALVMDQLPFAGLMTTYSANSDVTDSAASATGFACGRKTNNSMLGMLPDRTPVDSIAFSAHRAGFAVGLLTDDYFFGATPSAYYAHVPVRSEYETMALDASKCGYDVLLGYGGQDWFLPKDVAGGSRSDGQNLLSAMSKCGYTSCETLQSFISAPLDGGKLIGFMAKDEMADEKCFKTIMENSLARLSQGNKRFFVMMESCDPDHGSHANKPEVAISGVVKAEWAVRSAVEWSMAHGSDTLVIAMSDHETGWVTTVVSASSGRTSVHYGASTHTGAPVPVRAFGPGAERFEGVFDATDVYKRLMSLLDL